MLVLLLRPIHTPGLAIALTLAALLGSTLGGCSLLGEDDTTGSGLPSPTADPGGSVGPTSASPLASGRATTGPSLASGVRKKLTFAALLSRQRHVVGQRVEVVGKVFFFERCPPPDQGGGGCQLTGYLTAPDRTELNASDLDQAIQLAEGGSVVTCAEQQAVGLACPGWRHDARYRLEGVVAHQVRGGRETAYIELDVMDKELV
ncbi:MAG: hypothetical protein ABR549_16320 [Mycobacteriales bacterium]